MSETSLCRHLVEKYLVGPNGIDIGSGGDPVIATAVQIELPNDLFHNYGHAHPMFVVPQFRSTSWFRNLPFKDSMLDWVFSSHLLEDYDEWEFILNEWVRVVKTGGHIIVLSPDKERFNEAIRRGGSGNSSHRHEFYVGELSAWSKKRGGLEVLEDRFTNIRGDDDYNILFVAKKTE